MKVAGPLCSVMVEISSRLRGHVWHWYNVYIVNNVYVVTNVYIGTNVYIASSALVQHDQRLAGVADTPNFFRVAH